MWAATRCALSVTRPSSRSAGVGVWCSPIIVAPRLTRVLAAIIYARKRRPCCDKRHRTPPRFDYDSPRERTTAAVELGEVHTAVPVAWKFNRANSDLAEDNFAQCQKTTLFLNLLLAALVITLCAQNAKRPHRARASAQTKSNLEKELEFGWHVAVGWQVAVYFETDADFNQNRGCPGHSFLPLDPPEK
jgi:hypothetical protein